jgi:molybdate transport system substrate-binding protein
LNRFQSSFNSLAATLFILLLSFAALTACKSNPQNQAAELHVAAASDLIPAFEEIGREFEKSHNSKVIFSFGATGMLTRQIENGSPMDVFAAANVGFVEQLERKGMILSDTKAVYARGRIALWTRKDSGLTIEKIDDLARDEVKRIAIANPDYAPYGMAAREALESAGIWDAVKPKLVYGENIRQTLQFAETGNVEAAIVSLSLSSKSDGRWVLIPEELHKPISQGLAVIKETKNEKTAREFVSFVMGSQGQAILAKYGFEKQK